MMSEALNTHFSDVWLTVIGLLIFFLFFVSLLFQVSKKSKKIYFQKMSELPLKEERHE